MPVHDLIAGIGVGLIGGAASGLLGVSPGGGLVVFSILLLGSEQHAAQGVSLVAQLFPAGLSGISRYRRKGSRAPIRWLLWLTIGILAGGIGGALAALNIAGAALRWAYVFYLAALDALLILRRRDQHGDEAANDAAKQHSWAALLLVGTVAGFSSGFLGIGGGLAVTVGLSVWLRAPQHQAQMVSLVLAMMPTTIPAAWIYWRQGSLASWPAMAGVILGLCGGSDLGARLANSVAEATLRRILFGFVSAMALYMAYQALA